MKNKYRLVIFDKDGTLCPPLINAKGKPRPPNKTDEQSFYPDVLSTTQHWYENDAEFAVCSNQGGVGWGIMLEQDALALLDHAAEFIGARWRAVCYTHPQAKLAEYRVENDPRRKPNPGMLIELMQQAQATPEQTLYVGDSKEDEDAAAAAGCDFMWEDQFFGREQPSVYRIFNAHAERVAQEKQIEKTERFQIGQ